MNRVVARTFGFAFAFFCVGPAAFAGGLKLDIADSIQAGATLNYKVTFDEKSDVTDQATLTLPCRAEPKGQGFVFIPPTFKNGIETIKIRVEWEEVKGGARLLHTAEKVVKLNWDPKRIRIEGPSSVNYGGTVDLTAVGDYPEATQDLSHAGYWFSQFGEISSQGIYKAPANGAWSFDWIQFRYGTLTESSRITLY